MRIKIVEIGISNFIWQKPGTWNKTFPRLGLCSNIFLEATKLYYFRVRYRNLGRVMKHNILYTQQVERSGNVAPIASFHVHWPVPAWVILANTLGVINQITGYDGADKNIPPLITNP